MNTHELDLTKGNTLRTLIRFSVPILAANLLQSLYSMADMLVVGIFVGQTGLAAISNASMPFFLITSISIGFSMGGSVLVAHYKGAGDDAGQKRSVTVLFAAMFVLALVVTLASLAGHASLFLLMDVPAEALREANEYTRIVSFGIVFVFGYNAVSSVLRALGDSVSPLRFAMVATVINILVDVLLVGWLECGVSGAALATVLAQGAAFFIGLRDMFRRQLFGGCYKSDLAAARDTLKSIVSVGVPFATQMVIVNLSYLIVTGMTNTYGLTVAAAAGVGLKINTFAAMPCWAVGQAVTAMTAQNMGAGNIGKVREVVGHGFLCGLVPTGTLVLLIQLFPDQAMLLFDPRGGDFVNAGIGYLRMCCSVNCLFYVAMYTLDSFAVGAGAPKLALCNALLDSLALRLPLIWCLETVFSLGLTGLYIGQALAPIIPALIGATFFFRNRWTTIRRAQGEHYHSGEKKEKAS